MMPRSFLIPFVLLLLITGLSKGCTSEENSPKDTRITRLDDSESYEKIEPSQLLIDFAKQIESEGWVADTSRINKVGLYGLKEIDPEFVQGLPLYALNYDQTRVFNGLSFEDFEPQEEVDQVISKVASIWGYFYRDKDAENWITDGMIEEWTYQNEEEATAAFVELKKHGNFIFFNTMPFFHQMGKTIFIFHARAMAFSYSQKPIYESFVEKADDGKLR